MLGPEVAVGVEVEQGNNDEEVEDLDDDYNVKMKQRF